MRIALALMLCVTLASCVTPGEKPQTVYLVFFSPKSAVLLPVAARVLNGVAADANRQHAVVEVSGPAAARSSHQKPSLAEERTTAVEHALIAAGVAEEHIHRAAPTAAAKKRDRAGESVEIRLVAKPVA